MAFKTYILRRVALQVIIVLFLMCKTCLSQIPPETEHCDKGVEYAMQGKLQEAENEFKQALELNANFLRAKSYLKLITDVNDKKIDKDIAMRIFKGRYYNDKRMWDEAIAEFTEVIASMPNYANVYFDRGFAYKNKSQDDKAISDFTKSIEIDQRRALAYSERGSVYAGKGEHDQAISDFDKAIEINPNLAFAYFKKAQVYEKLNRKKEAIENYALFLKYASTENLDNKSYIKQAKENISVLEK